MKIKTKLLLLLTISLSLITIFSLLTFRGKALQEINQSIDTYQIQEVIKQSYTLEAAAGRTFDLSSFNKVFINDPRGGNLSLSTTDFINEVNQNKLEGQLGYLDYKLAYYTWWKNGALKYEAIKRNADDENRALTTNEIKSLVDNKGRMALPRLKGDYLAPTLVFMSIEVKDDQATTIFDDGLRTNQITLVRINNNWYIAGNKFLSIHP